MPDISVSERVSLFNVLDILSEPIEAQYPMPMEEMGQSYGYTLYTTTVERDRADEERIRVLRRDRAQVFVNGDKAGDGSIRSTSEKIFTAFFPVNTTAWMF